MRTWIALLAGVATFAAFACNGGADRPQTPAAPFVEQDSPPSVAPSPSVLAPTSTVAPIPAGPASQALREGRFSDAAVRFLEEARLASTAAAKSEALLGAGRARFESGDRFGAITSFREAVAAAVPGSPEARRAAYLLGLRLDDAGRGVEAVEVLRSQAEVGGGDALQPLLDSELARAAALAGDPSLSEAAFRRAVSHPQATTTLKAQAYAGLADAARKRGDLDGVIAALSKLVLLAPTPAGRYELGASAISKGDIATGVGQLRAVIEDNPESRFALLAITDLRNAGVDVDPGAEGLVYYRGGLYARAKLVLSVAKDDPSISAQVRAFRGFYYAATLEDSGDATGAIAAYDGIVDDVRYVHKARYWAARVLEGSGDGRGASVRYYALASALPRGEFTTEAAFRAGYTLFRAGDSRAAETWSSLGVSRDSRLLYWKGRALDQLGNKGDAATSYREAVAADARSFFGQEAAVALGGSRFSETAYVSRRVGSDALNWAEFERWLLGRGFPARVDVVPALARELMLVGLSQQAGAVLLEFGDSGDPWRQFAAMKGAYDLGLVSISAQLAVRLRMNLGVQYEQAPVLLARVAYPLDYSALLDEESRKNGLDPLFFAALIRQESFWDAAARSPADAYGLTQVIPETGRSIAGALSVSPFETSDLLRPAVALRFGAFYIGQQFKQYKSAYVALAAYNAGPGAASRWVLASPGQTAADFVETIDYAETQLYVQLIIEAYAHYRYAWIER